MEAFGRILIALYFCYGVVNGLDCISCSWDAMNATVDNDCLGAPYKTEVESCPTNAGRDKAYYCMTQAVFNFTNGFMSLQRLERNCQPKHSRCNNACAEGSTTCWLCCDDDNKCNSFPYRVNVVVMTSSASVFGLKILSTVLLLVISCLLS